MGHIYDTPYKNIRHSKMYFSSYPMSLNVNYLSTFNETLVHFNLIRFSLIFIYHIMTDLGLKRLPDCFQATLECSWFASFYTLS